jgi:hypothetical protein
MAVALRHLRISGCSPKNLLKITCLKWYECTTPRADWLRLIH